MEGTKVKIALTDEKGEVQELEGSSIIFYIVHSEKEEKGGTTVEARAGVFGTFSGAGIDAARDNILHAIDTCPSGKAGRALRELMSLAASITKKEK